MTPEKKLFHSIALLLMIALLLVGCNPADTQIAEENNHTTEADLGDPGETTIVIDGYGEDWQGRDLTRADPAEDAEEGYLDITSGYAFFTKDALYIYLDLLHPGQDYTQIDFELRPDGKMFLVSWEPGQPNPGGLQASAVAVAEGIEARFDLTDLDSPDDVQIAEIRIMAGECCEYPAWHPVDSWKPGTITFVNEVDAVPFVAQAQPEQPEQPAPEENQPSEESIFTEPQTERFGHVWTTSGLDTSYAYRSFLQIPVGAAWGPDGHLYIGDWTGHHIVKVADDGTLQDLGLWKTVGPLQYDGPRGIAFDAAGNLYTNNHGYIFRIDPDGNIESLPGVHGGPIGSIIISPSDELYYTDRGAGKLLKWNPEGSSTEILTGLPGAENMVFGLDGTLYMTQLNSPDVLKVDVETGEFETFVTGVCGVDPCYLAVDPDGDIWTRELEMHQFTPEGVEKPFIVNGETYPGGSINWWTPAAITFDDQGRLWISSYTSLLVRLTPESTDTPDPAFTSEVIHPGIAAYSIALDSSGSVLAADFNTGRVVSISPESQLDVLLEYGYQDWFAVAVDENDTVFAGSISGEILEIKPDGTIDHLVNVDTDSMTFGANGILYAVVNAGGNNKKIIQINGVDDFSTLALEIDGVALSANQILIAPALDDGLYVFNVDQRLIFFLDFEGNGYLVTDLKEDMPELGDLGWLNSSGPIAFAASPITGDIFMVPHGPYELYRLTPEGEFSKVAVGVYGDPLGMVVSRDGQFLYVAESGVIDIIPIGDQQP